MGTVYIKDIAISLADDRLIQVESDDKKVKLVVWKEDVDSASLTNDDLKKLQINILKHINIWLS